jgi:hypothetical protein
MHDLQEVVRDTATYPTPVTVVGSMHSVNECIVNDGGTLLVTSGMEGIVGVVGGGEQRLVTVQAGCKLAKLHSWLADRVGGQACLLLAATSSPWSGATAVRHSHRAAVLTVTTAVRNWRRHSTPLCLDELSQRQLTSGTSTTGNSHWPTLLPSPRRTLS